MPSKRIHGIGLAAYIKMHGFKIESVRKSHVVFICPTDADWKRIDQLELEYANGDYAKFDSMVVDLKSLPVVNANTMDPRIQMIDNLGQAAYLQMTRMSTAQWSAIGRSVSSGQWGGDGKNTGKYVFEVRPEEMETFEAKMAAWANSRFRDFNQEIRTIMSLKKRS